MKEKNYNTASLVLTGILTFAFVAMLALYIFIPLITFLLLMILDGIFLIILFSMLAKKNRKIKSCSITFTCVFAASAMFLAMFNLPFSVHTKWQYPLALKYAASDTFLPDTLPESAEDVEFEFMPTILQGTGHVAVGFTASDDYIEELTEELSEEAIIIYEYDSPEEMIYKDAEIKVQAEDSNSTLDVYEGKIGSEHPGSTVYVLSTNFNWNHPRAEAVFIDGNYIFFSDM